MMDLEVEVRCRGMWFLQAASNVPVRSLFVLVSRLVRFEYRNPPKGRWHLSATAYDLIDWEHFDDGDGDDDWGQLIPVGWPA